MYMGMNRRILIIILLMFGLTSCSDGKLYPFWAKAASLRIHDGPPGPPNYRQGYKDGCESGFKAYSQHYNKVWWEFRQDKNLRQDPVYYQIWKDAYSYCASFANSAGLHGLGNYK